MALEQDVYQLVNEERKAQGFPPLQWSEGAAKAARVKAEDLWNKNYFDHRSPVYGSPEALLKRMGVTFTGSGENLGHGPPNAEGLMQGWMASPGHRVNILHESFTHLGVGAFHVPETGEVYVIQLFLKV